MPPFFSIIIPTFNRADKLKKAIDSVLSQTFSDFEILVMDDGSTDHTGELINTYNDSRIHYSWGENFGGPAKPRNLGINRAKGEWVCFLDADDWWKSNKLQVCLSHLHAKVDFLYHDMAISRDGVNCGGKLKSRTLKKPVLKDLLLGGNAIINSSAMVRRSVLMKAGEFNEALEMVAAEDFNMWLKVAQITDKFLYLPVILGYYLMHDKNISSRNMAIPEKFSVTPFIETLSYQEKISLNKRIELMSALYYCSRENLKKSWASLGYIIRNGSLKLKIKGLLIFFRIFR